MVEQDPQFEQRKRDHIRIALDSKAQSEKSTGLESLELLHEALPDLNFSDIDLRQSFFDQTLSAPFFISSMTAGHEGGESLNRRLARFAADRGLLMGVGSQRKELIDPEAASEWKRLRQEAPKAVLLGNLGIAQLIQTPLEQVRRLVDNLEAAALFIHTNPLQEALQPEGTREFKGSLRALEAAVKALPVPVILKETGSGFSRATLERLRGLGLYAVDVSGRGGTHWGRVENLRRVDQEGSSHSGTLFSDWGISTLQSMLNAKDANVDFKVWGSGGIRNGLEVAKLIALGAEFVGLAKPWLDAALTAQPEEDLHQFADRLEEELKISLFCTGSRTPAELRTSEKWTWRKH